MNIKRRLTVLFLAGLLLLSLASCKALDRKKAESAYWADEMMSAINWQGKKYVLSDVKLGEEFLVMGERIWVNHPDVPALLNSWKGSPFSTDKEHEVLLDKRAGIYPASDVNNASASHAVFILEDLKDEIEAELKNLKMDQYCMQLSLASGDMTILLPESIENQLNKILDSGKKLSYDELKEDKTLSDIMFRASDFLQLAPCDEKMLTLNGYLQVYYYVSPEGEKSVLIGGNTGDEDFYIGLDNTAFYNELKALRNEALQ